MNKIQELKLKIEYYDKKYYEEGVSEISDSEYDRLYQEYTELEKQNPELKLLPDSPTKRIGAGAYAGETTGLPKFNHKTPLLSIDRKAKELDELKDFYDKIGGDGTEVIIEPKFDGITCNINYENKTFVNAATRGNGYIGDLITDNFKNTETKFPQTIDRDVLEIRGEAIIPYSFFKEYLKDEYSNPRNAVAGIMRQISPAEVKGKGVKVIFYDIGTNSKDKSLIYHDVDNDDDPILGTIKYDSDQVFLIRDLGFEYAPFYIAKTWDELKEIVETKMFGAIKNIDGFNVLSGYPDIPDAVCDGLVIKVNDLSLRNEIGMSEKGPKWAFAYKFKPLQAYTIIDHVEWQVGRTGKITPVAVFRPVSLGGTTISKATLNNFEYMNSLPRTNEKGEILSGTKCKLGFGDTIIVERSNDVIPRIVAIKEHLGYNCFEPQSMEIQKENHKKKQSFNEPDKCPVCGQKIKKIGPLHFCENLECPATAKGRLEHFVSRNAMNITGLGESIIDLLYEGNFAVKPSDLYYIFNDEKLLLEYEGLGKKKLHKIFEEIENSKKVELDKFIYALSIPNVGRKTAKDLSKKFSTIDKFLNATKKELLEVEDIGDIVADSIIDYITSENTLKEIKDLLEAGVSPKNNQILGEKLLGKIFVITGTLEHPRDYYIKLIEENGGKVSNSVSKKTNYVLIGENAGSKEEKAKKLIQENVPIVILKSQNEFLELLQK